MNNILVCVVYTAAAMVLTAIPAWVPLTFAGAFGILGLLEFFSDGRVS